MIGLFGFRDKQKGRLNVDECEARGFLQAEEDNRAKEEKRKRKAISRKEARQAMREVAESLGMSVVRGSVSGRYYME